MEKELEKFMSNVKFIGSKDLAEYRDDKGNLINLPLVQLVCSCEYIKAQEKEFKELVFQDKKLKDIEFNKITDTIIIDKWEKTKNKRDMGTLIEEEVEVYELWRVKNSLGLYKFFNNKEEAIKLTEEINDKVLKEAKLV